MRPSKRRQFTPHRRCAVTDKICFPDHAATIPALWSAELARTRANENGSECRRREQRSYKCPHCRQWHLTSQA